MKFEEALSRMREGSKIRVKGMPDDEYYQGCYIRLAPEFCSNQESESFEKMKARGMSIAWMKGAKTHPDMIPKWDLFDPKTDPCKHGWNPMIDLFWLMSNDWEIYDG